MTAIILLGPPGAGKGTIAEVMVEQGFTHISTGKLLRDQIRMETPLGLEAKKLIDRGRFVPDSVVIELIGNLLRNCEPERKLLFDGFPRNIVQAEAFDKLLLSEGGSLAEVILLECSDQVLVERLSGRRTCKKCGLVYHVDYNPSSVSGQCDIDGCELLLRADDAAETVEKRLKIYADKTAPLISYYEAKGLIHKVDASQSIQEVRKAVLERLV